MKLKVQCRYRVDDTLEKKNVLSQNTRTQVDFQYICLHLVHDKDECVYSHNEKKRHKET